MKRHFKKLTSYFLVITLMLTGAFNMVKPMKAEASNIVIVLDPGHGGSDAGTTNSGLGLREKDVNLKIALYAREYLSKYSSVTVKMTRDSDTYVRLKDRSIYAKDVNADLFVSLHNNAANSSSARGSEVYIPFEYQKSNMNRLASSILTNLGQLGLQNRGVKTRVEDGEDYYSVIREGVKRGIPSIIVEHAFVSNYDDATTYLSNDSQLKALGEADAKAIADYYGLQSGQGEYLPNDSGISVTYQTHVQNYGWLGWVNDGTISGTEGQALRMEAVNLKVNGLPQGARILARSHVQNYGWKAASVVDGSIRLGTTGEGLRMEAIQLTLDGVPGYGLRYRVHVQDYGWMDWQYQGSTAGTFGESKRIEAIQLQVVKDGNSYTTYNPTVEAQAHVENDGWLSVAQTPQIVGTEGESKRVEGIIMEVVNGPANAYISGRAHIENYGWVDYPVLNSGVMLGTEGQALRLEAVQLYLNNMPGFVLQYRAHIQNIGWTGWLNQGELGGTEGQALRLEALQFRIVRQ